VLLNARSCFSCSNIVRRNDLTVDPATMRDEAALLSSVYEVPRLLLLPYVSLVLFSLREVSLKIGEQSTLILNNELDQLL